MMDKERLKKAREIFAEKSGLKLNPDDKITDMVIEGQIKNLEEKGFAYCPCKLLTKDPEKNKKLICPCFDHKEEIEKDGHCHCLLFFRK